MFNNLFSRKVSSVEENSISGRLDLKAFDRLVISASNLSVVLRQEPYFCLKANNDFWKSCSVRQEASGKALVVESNKRAGRQVRNTPVSLTIEFPIVREIINSGSSCINSDSKLALADLKIVNSGSGRSEFQVQTSTLMACVSGSADLKLSGLCSELSFSMTGSGSLDAPSLRVSAVFMNSSGSGSVRLGHVPAFYGISSGSGDVRLSDRPATCTFQTSGSGRLLQGNDVSLSASMT